MTTLKGTKFFGIVEVTDDYTIRVSNDLGVTRLPISQLGDADFKKYGLTKLSLQRWTPLGPAQRSLGKFTDRKSGVQGFKIEWKLISRDPSGARSPRFNPSFRPTKRHSGRRRAKNRPQAQPTLKRRPRDPTRRSPQCFRSREWPVPLPEPFTGLGSSALQPISGAAFGATGVIQSATGAPSLPTTPP